MAAPVPAQRAGGGRPGVAPSIPTRPAAPPPPAAAPPTATAGIDPKKLSGPTRNAFLALEDLFDSYGLKSLAPKILQYSQAGYDGATASFMLQNTDEYKKRFAGNALRAKAGFAVLSPAEYLSTERAYKDAAAAYGLPKGFYDAPDDFAKLIGSDISGQEFATRAGYAFKFAQSTNSDTRALLHQYYGVDDSHLAAYFLDPTKGQAILDRQAQTVDIGAAAMRNNIGLSKDKAEQYADWGLSTAQVAAGASQAEGVMLGGEANIAKRFGQSYSSDDAADEFIGNSASAARKRNLLNQQETALFSVNEGTTKSFSTDNSGSY